MQSGRDEKPWRGKAVEMKIGSDVKREMQRRRDEKTER